nr:hypothetical protein [Hymenobacter terrenus]
MRNSCYPCRSRNGGVDRTREEVVERLKQHMRPEFLNRIDEIVMFQPLKRKEIRRIVDIQFKQIQ